MSTEGAGEQFSSMNEEKVEIEVGGVEVVGNSSVSNGLFQNFLKQIPDCKNLLELKKELREARKGLMELGLFNDIRFTVEPAEYLPQLSEVILVVEEKQHNKTIFNTSVGTLGQTVVSFLLPIFSILPPSQSLLFYLLLLLFLFTRLIFYINRLILKNKECDTHKRELFWERREIEHFFNSFEATLFLFCQLGEAVAERKVWTLSKGWSGVGE